MFSSSFETLLVGFPLLVSNLHTNVNYVLCPAFVKAYINNEYLTAYTGTVNSA
jgi:hypothetical protein